MKSNRHITELFLLMSLLLVANAASAAAGWTDSGTITSLNQQPATGAGANLVFVDVNVAINPSDPAACTARNGFYFGVSDDRRKRLFASLLAAQMSSRTVKVYTTGVCGAWGYAELDGLIVQ